MHKTARVTVTGVVQGVGYRYFCCRKAGEYLIRGWVKNERNGSVVVLAQGEPGSLEQFINELREGPPGAAVQKVTVDYEQTNDQFNSFEVRRF
ncbi:MAG: acylphosphatase [candidate division Zixibacteria bacterium]|nr:acylphosphatase [candidate division Zixibacteria bacterium]